MNFFFPPRSRQYFLAVLLLISGFFLLLPNPAEAQNSTNNFTGPTAGSLLTTTNWSLVHVPTVSEDAVFPVGATTGIRTLTAGSLTVGSFDVLATTGTFSIRNNTSTATNSTLTLGGAGDLGNGVSETSADLLYNASGSTFNIIGPNGSTGAGVLNVLLGQSGNFDAAGTMTISAAISGSGFGITKSGSGTLTLSGINSYTGGTTINSGKLLLSGSGTLGATTGSLTMNGGTLDLNGTNQSVGALNGSGGTILNDLAGGTKTLAIGNGDASGSFSGTITDHSGLGSGFVKLVKTGTGTENMTSITSNYTGGTDINGGVLLSNSSNGGALGRGPITVNNTGTLGGSGTIDSAATITVKSGGTLAPGATFSPASVAKLNTGAIDLQSNSNFVLELNAGAGPTGAGAGTLYDEISVTGTVTLGGGNLTINPGPGLQLGDKFFIVLHDGFEPISGTFNGISNISTFTAGGDTFLINYADIGGTGLDVTPNDISLTVVGIPEPSTWLAGMLALGALGCAQRKRIAAMLGTRREAEC
jgi:fibronectin-binding autotransporter adhesin